jgi:hypothetical protein
MLDGIVFCKPGAPRCTEVPNTIRWVRSPTAAIHDNANGAWPQTRHGWK